MIKKRYLVATRPSILAYTQTKKVVDLLREKNFNIEFDIIKISTYGDYIKDKPIRTFGGTGVFVKELENAIIDGKVDFAVHSLKDVPSIQPEGLTLASFIKREDPRDVLLTRNNNSIYDLDEKCIIGTSSLRRIVQLMKIKPQAQFKDIRGNIDTRIQKLLKGEYDAIVLAASGLLRLEKQIPENAFLSLSDFLPAIGQGVIVLECKSEDKDLIDLLRIINDTETEIVVKAERSYMKNIGGCCKFPLAAYACIKNTQLTMDAMIGNHLTGEIIRLFGKDSCDKAEYLGEILAKRIKEECKIRGIVIER